MNKAGWFLLGAIALLVAEALAAAIALSRARGVSAQEEPNGVERWIARRARHVAVPSGARNRTNPVSKTQEVLAEARAHWADHCFSCHANDGSGETAMGRHMYPQAPDMRKPATQNLSDGELFYIVQNGIRLTGMPAWGGSDRDAEDSWKLVYFIRHLPDLTLEERTQMEKLNPKGLEDRNEEEEEERFLKGESSNTPQQHHHH